MSFQLDLFYNKFKNKKIDRSLIQDLKKEIIAIHNKYKKENSSINDLVNNKPEILIDIKSRIENVISKKYNKNIKIDETKYFNILRNTPIDILSDYTKKTLKILKIDYPS